MTKSIFTSFMITILVLFTVFNGNGQSIKETFTIKEVFEMAKNNVLLIDVREADEVAEHAYDVKNLLNIPLDSIEIKQDIIPKDMLVVLVCKSGYRSGQAYEILKKKGFTNLAKMEGGMNAWSEAGLPTKSNEIIAGEEKKVCCSQSSSKNCNPDGSCKTNTATDKKTCCATPNSKDNNQTGSCKSSTNSAKNACCSKSNN